MELMSCSVCGLLYWILPLWLSSHPVVSAYYFRFYHVMWCTQTVCECHITQWNKGEIVDKEENYKTKNLKCVLNKTVISKLNTGLHMAVYVARWRDSKYRHFGHLLWCRSYVVSSILVWHSNELGYKLACLAFSLFFAQQVMSWRRIGGARA